MYALSMLALFVGFVSLIMIVASLFTPRTAIFLKTKTRPRGAIMWLLIGFASLVIIGLINQAMFPEAQAVDFNPLWP